MTYQSITTLFFQLLQHEIDNVCLCTEKIQCLIKYLRKEKETSQNQWIQRWNLRPLGLLLSSLWGREGESWLWPQHRKPGPTLDHGTLWSLQLGKWNLSYLQPSCRQFSTWKNKHIGFPYLNPCAQIAIIQGNKKRELAISNNNWKELMF